MPASYAPYSGTEEICYIEGESGLFYAGVRVENVSFPLTISAIQAAVCSCLANGDNPVAYFFTKSESELAAVWIDEFGIKPLHKTFSVVEKDLFNPLIQDIPDIGYHLKELSQTAVIPNSDFPVSALIETDSGYIEGVNIEPKAWSMGLCAERVAISRCVAAGVLKYTAIHIYAPESGFVSPCGACRQVLAEFMPESPAELHHGDGTLSKHIVSHLLPFGFTSDKLRK
jgi:homotetrameric cytidine deaminase